MWFRRRAHILEYTLQEIQAPMTVPTNAFYLVWAKSSLRHPRVALAREALIGALQDENWHDEGDGGKFSPQ